MKSLKASLTVLFALALGLTHAQDVIYVDGDAAGNNDGSSWNNAYVDLSAALNAAVSGDQIWVAEGVYLPGGATPSRESFFSIEDGISLYGGFDGTESQLDERDVEENETILSGDLNGDDLAGDFVNNRTDNTKHICFVPETAGASTRIDGFTLRNGQTDDASASGDDRRGGAILSYGSPVVANCFFTANFGFYAGAVYPRGGFSTGMVIDNCRFFDNLGGWGGSMYIVSNENVRITNCIFESNVCQNRGGAVYNAGGSTVFANCEFLNNSAASSGAVYHNSIDDPETVSVSFTNSIFMGNRGNFGGAMSLYGNGTSLVDNCVFDGNTADAGGGALSIGFTNNSMIKSSDFTNNQADRGGAIWQQNDTTMVTIEDCAFETNLCVTSNGGAIYQRGSAALRISDSRFEGNRASFGGAIYMIEDSVDLSNMVLDRCYFNFNVADEQGGAINLSNADSYITNCLISNSLLSSGQVGGGISTNCSGGDTTEVVLLNSTLYANLALIGAGVAQWTDSDTSVIKLVSQNTIYANLGNNYEIEDGSPDFQSNGGNLSTDLTLSAQANEPNDFHNEDPLLVNPAADDYRLGAGSLCIDNGSPAGAPDVDITGKARVGVPDIGAYEFEAGVSTSDIDNEIKVLTFPNPVRDRVNLEWEADQIGQAVIDIYDINGRLVHTKEVAKQSKLARVSLDVDHLTSGDYRIVIYQGDRRFIGQFVRL